MRISVALLSLALLCGILQAGEGYYVDPAGRLSMLELDDEPIEIHTHLKVFAPGWTNQVRQGDHKVARRIRRKGDVYRGRMKIGDGTLRFIKSLRREGDEVRVHLQATADRELDCEGAFLYVSLPTGEYVGGKVMLETTDGPGEIALPAEASMDEHVLGSAKTGLIRISPAGGGRTLTVKITRSTGVQVQDGRKWGGQFFALHIPIHHGRIPAKTPIEQGVSISVSGQADRQPAKLTIRPDEMLYDFDGIGGNYCFNIESPVTTFTMEQYRIGWARTEMTLKEWEPKNDDENPYHLNDGSFAMQMHGGNLRREINLGRELKARGVPVVVSVWHLPDWMYERKGLGPDVHGRRVGPGKWPELVESVGAYLWLNKRRNKYEADLFSLNEPDWGVRVKLSPVEHAEAIRRFGAHFEQLGLKTRCLLGDVTTPHRMDYLQPALDDPEAMKYVGAIAFHSWGGASPETYAKWHELAKRLDLPLLVTEVGVDAHAWHVPGLHDTWPYALRELKLYQELLLHARPRATMQWEFTSDYGLARWSEGRIHPSKRFYLLKQLANWTPPKAKGLAVGSDHPKVLMTAFRGEHDGWPVFVMHVANLGAGREATMTGLPDDVEKLHGVVSGRDASYEHIKPIPITDGAVKLTLPPQSLTTLTTHVGEFHTTPEP